jgi:hypothetical protein
MTTSNDQGTVILSVAASTRATSTRDHLVLDTHVHWPFHDSR